jgi:hypothetical protein
MPLFRWSFILSFACLALVGGPAAVRADDFRVDNKVVFPGQEPILSTTLFANGKVYNCLDAVKKTLVFDKTAGVIVILDQAKQTKTQIAMVDVSAAIGRLREAVRSDNREVIRMSASPQFTENINPQTGRLILDSKWTTYIVATEAPENPFAARQYNEFADWQIQIAAVLNPMPPFARLKLNEVLKRRQEAPTEIDLISRGENEKQPLEVRSEHRYTWRLSPADQQRIAAANQQLEEFQQIPFEEFRRAAEE